MKKIKYFITIILCMIMLIPTITVAGIKDSHSTLTLVMEYGDIKLDGMTVSVCRVADVKEYKDGVSYEATSEFLGAGADFTNLEKEKNIVVAANLHSHATNNSVDRHIKNTDVNGRVMYDKLEAGLYLISQHDAKKGEHVFTPYLVAVPVPHEVNEGEWNYSVVAYPKSEIYIEDDEPISIKVSKVWAGSSNNPSSIKVRLYIDGTQFGDDVTLNEGNFWSHTWNDLEANHTWTVDEIDVPAGYIKTITGDRTTGYIITNTKTYVTPTPTPKIDEPTPAPYDNPPTYYPPNDNYNPPERTYNPKTGDVNSMGLWLMILSLGVVGLTTAICIRRSKRKANK